MMPFTSPGQRETRRLTLKDELRRVWHTTSGMLWLGTAILSLFIINFALLGYWFAWVLGLLLISYAYFRIVYKPVRKAMKESQPVFIFVFIFVLILVAWAFFGQPWIERTWPFHRIAWNPWIKFFLVVLSCAVMIAFAFGLRALFIEQVDPNGPTAPRKAITRDGPILPWHRETFDNTRRPWEPEVVPARIVRVQVVTDSNGKNIRDIFFPDTDAWKKFAVSVLAGTTEFTEVGAKKFKVPLTDVGKPDTPQYQPGFRTVRASAIARGLMAWKNPDRHQVGIDIHDGGKAALKGLCDDEG